MNEFIPLDDRGIVIGQCIEDIRKVIKEKGIENIQAFVIMACGGPGQIEIQLAGKPYRYMVALCEVLIYLTRQFDGEHAKELLDAILPHMIRWYTVLDGEGLTDA